ncbi:hypothetical protein EBZ38_14115 [bacterium]|nr:hypothetical protein [bacterium]NDC95120.1 hypothetical protein [bacterium]NDD85393.1 hypothetical protein [bacterium]
MHEDYDYGDDYDYDDSQDDLEKKYKHYFKFDPTAWDAWGKMLYDALNNIVETSPNVWYIGGFPNKSFPVNSYFSNAGKGNSFQYLGNNYDNVKVWKKKYFIHDPIDGMYLNHLKSNAVHFLKQPHYYKNMFDILN